MQPGMFEADFSRVPALSPAAGAGVQRKCSCGAGGGDHEPCEECKGKAQKKDLEGVPVSRPGDPLEMEADRAAEQILRMPDSQSRSGPEAGGSSGSSGGPLPQSLREFFEPRFGRDFSGVRVHSDGRAAQMARSVQAQAYTLGQDVVFGAGRYAPHTREGLGLLAHELAHVVQQSGGSTARAVQRQPEVSAADAKNDAKLHRMARRPGEALTAWKTLKQGDRDSILWMIADMYGADFESEFLKYANGEKKPNISATIANKSKFPPEQLTDRGYRLADSGSPEIWVHPSGHEYQLLATSTAPDDPTDERCIDPCLLSTADEDACHECCDTKIPESDGPCRRMCHEACGRKLG
jgi:hypothetical protein